MEKEKRFIVIKYEELKYVPCSLKVYDDKEAERIYQKLKKRNDIRNLRRL